MHSRYLIASAIHHKNGRSAALPYIAVDVDQRVNYADFDAGTMHSGQLQHTNCNYITAAIKSLFDNRRLIDLAPIAPYNSGDINVSCSLQVSQRGGDRKVHSCVL
jgi:hypothetical protein